jgi:serine/threonine-protein kinase HipA
MRTAKVYYNHIFAGTLIEESRKQYQFTYDDDYFKNPSLPAISLTLPKTRQTFQEAFLFPFFYNMLAEGVNRKLQSRFFKIDEDDSFGLLIATAGIDTIGAITIKPSF